MDPNAALSTIRARIADLREFQRGVERHDQTNEVESDFGKLKEFFNEHMELSTELVELVDGLDDWLTRRGFLPIEWTDREGIAHVLTFPGDAWDGLALILEDWCSRGITVVVDGHKGDCVQLEDHNVLVVEGRDGVTRRYDATKGELNLVHYC